MAGAAGGCAAAVIALANGVSWSVAGLYASDVAALVFIVWVWIGVGRADGEAPGPSHGVDVDADGNRCSWTAGTVRERTLEITFLEPGAEAYSFTFG